MAYARRAGVSRCCLTGFGGLVDQDDVGSRISAWADAEEGIEGGMTCVAPIEPEHAFVEVVLECQTIRCVHEG